MGQQTFQQIVDEARMTGALLHPQHRACQAVRRVGTRVAQAATDGFGGGFQVWGTAAVWKALAWASVHVVAARPARRRQQPDLWTSSTC